MTCLPDPPSLRLPRSGRRLTVASEERGEILEIRDPEGLVELRIVATPEGPVLMFHSARMQLTARDINLDCDRFALRSSDVEIISDDQVAIRGEGDVTVDGMHLLLNCGERPVPRG